MSDLFAVDPNYVYRVQNRHLFWAFEEDDEDGGVPFGRPPTNPWRHAYVRAMHFRRAAKRLRTKYGAVAVHGIISRPLYHGWQAAESACNRAAWGCDPEQHVKRPDS